MAKKKRTPTKESQLARVVREDPMFRVRCLDESNDKKRYTRKSKHKGGWDYQLAA